MIDGLVIHRLGCLFTDRTTAEDGFSDIHFVDPIIFKKWRGIRRAVLILINFGILNYPGCRQLSQMLPASKRTHIYSMGTGESQ
jgi:hypothetical protein